MKTNINIHNYKEIWTKYLNGVLSEKEEELLFDYLENNPELYNMLESDVQNIDEITLTPISAQYDDKQNLKAENQIENMLIAKIENVISEENDKYITEKINSCPKTAKAYAQYKNSIIKPDTNIKYPEKSQLYRRKTIPLYQKISAVAAIFFILYISGTFIFRASEDIFIEPASFSELRISDKDIKENIKSDKEFELTKDVSEKNKEKIITEIKNDKTEYLASKTEIETIDNTTKQTVKIERMPIKEARPVFVNNQTDIINNVDLYAVNHNKAQKDEESNSTINFTLEYTRHEDQNNLVAIANKIFETGRDINLRENIQTLREKRNEFLSVNLSR